MLLDALNQAWPPFVLVVGLLLVGQAAAEDGLFQAVGARLAQAPISPRLLLVSLLALVASVTAVLNLDTSVVFMTPVLVHAARGRRIDEQPFLYGAVLMSNSASLLLPGSNLTNLLVVGGNHADGLAFARQMVLPWLAACALTTLLLLVVFRPPRGRGARNEPPPLVLGLGAAGVALAAVLVVAVRDPAPAVLAVGLAVTGVRRLRPSVDLRVLVPLFLLTVALGAAARASEAPAAALEHAGPWATAGVAALAANLVNNLPAAVLLSARPPAHPRALLLGLDLGPNLAVTGSLSAYLWFRAAKRVGARPSVRMYTLLGLVLVPATLAAGLFVDGAILTRS